MFISFIQKSVIWIFLFWRIDSRQTGYQHKIRFQKIEISINLFTALLSYSQSHVSLDIFIYR